MQNNNNRSLRNEKLKANRALEVSEEQSKERVRIGREKDRARRIKRGKEKVVRNRRLRETALGHSQELRIPSGTLVAICFKLPKLTLNMRMFGLHISSHAFWHFHRIIDKPTYQHTYIYHAKSRLNSPVWGLA